MLHPRGEVEEEEDLFPALSAVGKARSRGNPLAVHLQGRDLSSPFLGGWRGGDGGAAGLGLGNSGTWRAASSGAAAALAPERRGAWRGGCRAPGLAEGGSPSRAACAKGDSPFSSGRKFLTRKDKESIFTMDHFPLWYRRAAEHPPGSFIYSIVSEDDSGNLSLNARKKKRKLWARSDPFIASVAQ